MELPEPSNAVFEPLFQRAFTQNDLQISWTERQLRRAKGMRTLEEQFWQSFRSAHPDRSLYDGALCRLQAYQVTDDGVRIALGPITFKTHLYHLNIVGQARKRRLEGFGLGVSSVIITADDRLLYLRRSDTVASAPGQLDVFGGHIDPHNHVTAMDDGTHMPCPFSAILSEIEEELSLKEDQIVSINGIGLIRNSQTGQPELLFKCTTSLPASQVISQAGGARDRHEYSEILHTDNNPESLMQICCDQALDFSPSGLANLWFHANGP